MVKEKGISNLMLVILVVILLAAASIAVFTVRLKSNKAAPTTQTIEITPATESVSDSYADWTVFRNGYGIKLPPHWKNTSDKGGTAILEPGDKIAHITKVAITVLSDEKAPPGQRFTTQKEFDEWSQVHSQVQGTIQKLENVTIDGSKGIMLIDTKTTENKWTVIIWVRNDNTNLYITVYGTGTYDSSDKTAIDYLKSSFSFVAPTSIPGADK